MAAEGGRGIECGSGKLAWAAAERSGMRWAHCLSVGCDAVVGEEMRAGRGGRWCLQLAAAVAGWQHRGGGGVVGIIGSGWCRRMEV